MEIYTLMEMLQKFLSIGDFIDRSGVESAKTLTDGKYTTRYIIISELTQLLLYIGCSNNYLNEEEVNLLNTFSGYNFTESEWLELESTTVVFEPSTSGTLISFISADIELSRRNGTKHTNATDTIIFLFEELGKMMVSFDKNPVAENRLAKHINVMRNVAKKSLWNI